MNNCTFTGNLVRDPKLDDVGDKKVCNFTLANNEGWGDKQTVTYIDVSVWGGQAAACAEHLFKGRPAAVSGSISLRKWKTKDDEERSVLSLRANRVDFLGGCKDKPETSTTPASSEPDDIPF